MQTSLTLRVTKNDAKSCTASDLSQRERKQTTSTPMIKLLRILVTLPAILFVVMGLRWMTDPAGAAGSLGMPLLDGLGRSSQIGDVGTLFLTMGLMILIGLVTSTRSWFYAPALMLSVVALFRLLAWLFHDAPLAPDMIAVEVIIATLLLFSAAKLSVKE
jgi:hypothetical protein